MKEIILTSENKAKYLATKKVFSQYYPDINITPLAVASDVNITPSTDDEGIQGCLNRIANAITIKTGDTLA